MCGSASGQVTSTRMRRLCVIDSSGYDRVQLGAGVGRDSARRTRRVHSSKRSCGIVAQDADDRPAGVRGVRRRSARRGRRPRARSRRRSRGRPAPGGSRRRRTRPRRRSCAARRTARSLPTLGDWRTTRRPKPEVSPVVRAPNMPWRAIGCSARSSSRCAGSWSAACSAFCSGCWELMKWSPRGWSRRGSCRRRARSSSSISFLRCAPILVFWILSCSLRIASRSISGRGGQPGR